METRGADEISTLAQTVELTAAWNGKQRLNDVDQAPSTPDEERRKRERTLLLR